MASQVTVERAYRLHGRVQGVGFRWWTQRTARGLDLSGWVRNCADGTVEVVLAGPQQAVDEMASQLREGPRSANVQRMEEMELPDSIPDGFQIAR